MKRIHLLRVDGPPRDFAALVEALESDGGRVGWLDLSPSESPPVALERAASVGVLRAVAAGERRTVAVKPLRGAPVLADLLREHFRGCRLVLVAGSPEGAVAAPLLEPHEEGWRVCGEAGSDSHSTASLVAALRKPRPWAADPAAES